MNPIYFTKGKLSINGYEIIVLNGSLRNRYSEEELRTLNEGSVIPGMALVPYRQQTLLTGEFVPSLHGLESILSGKADFQCLTTDGKSAAFNLNLYGRHNDNLLADGI
jgi:hypothetical protein